MNIWENSVITQKGLALQSKLIEGHSLEITRAAVGTDYVAPVLLIQQTAMTNAKQALKISKVTYPEEGKCALALRLENEDLATGYTATQVGVFAQDPDEGEILYFISQAENGSGIEVPSEAEMPSYLAEWTFYFQYGNADGVTATVDPAFTMRADAPVAYLLLDEE